MNDWQYQVKKHLENFARILHELLNPDNHLIADIYTNL